MFPLEAFHTKIIIIIFGNVSFVFMDNNNKNTGSYWMLNIIIESCFEAIKAGNIWFLMLQTHSCIKAALFFRLLWSLRIISGVLGP